MENNRNFFIAISLSFLIIIGWQYFFSPRPQTNQEHSLSSHTDHGSSSPEEIIPDGNPVTKPVTAEPTSADLSTDPAPISIQDHSQTSPLPMTEATRMHLIQQQKNQHQRILIDTNELEGSINLVGSRIDDLRLKKYHVTVDKNSANIDLLNPENFKQGYFVEFGFSSPETMPVPRDKTLWKLDGENQILTPTTPVKLIFDNGSGLIFHRTISVDDNTMFRFTDVVSNHSDKEVFLKNYGRVLRVSPPDIASGNYLLHEGMIGVIGTEGLKTKTYKDLSEAEPKDRVIRFPENKTGWVGITDKYWAVALIPENNIDFTARFSFNDTGKTRYQSDFSTQNFSLSPGQDITFVNHVFAGAKRNDLINHYEKQLNIKQFELLIDWGLLKFITKPMFLLIDWLFKLVGNFGVAILLVTVILKLFLFPLANKSYRSMAKMKNFQPAMLEIRKKYEQDKVKQQQAIMELYRREKINPLAGCWPLLVQFPIFFALYKVLYITIEMRHAPFFGWILDLAAPDPTSIFNLFGLLPYALPAFLIIGFWPIMMGVTMFLQMRMNPTPPDPTQAMIFNWMPLVFTFMLASFPAGLVIYWAWNNTLSIIQQAVIMKKHGAKIELFDNLKRIVSRKSSDSKSTETTKQQK